MSKHLYFLFVDLLISFVAFIIFISFTAHRYADYEHERQNRSDRCQSRNEGNGLQHCNYKEVEISQSPKLVIQTQRQEVPRCVIGRRDVIAPKLAALVLVVIQMHDPGLCH